MLIQLCLKYSCAKSITHAAHTEKQPFLTQLCSEHMALLTVHVLANHRSAQKICHLIYTSHTSSVPHLVDKDEVVFSIEAMGPSLFYMKSRYFRSWHMCWTSERNDKHRTIIQISLVTEQGQSLY